ncbi:MAG TPA: VOC family protein [Longimicrobium sp.]|nr:VOC family protein [Longimicrobium sp.]
MTSPTTHAPGTFCWLDLGAHDPQAARRFYTALFGWEADDNQYGPAEGDVYTMYRLDGKDVAASYGMDPNQKTMGIPSAWLCYVAVENADASAARAKELGATLMAEPFDVMEVGRMALVQDPTGALFALWQAARHTGFGVRGEPGSAGWFELATTDAARATSFYQELFGWTGQTMNAAGGMDYTVFSGSTGMIGGMYQIGPQQAGMPPCWMPYFVVENTDAAADKAKTLGAEVMHGPMDIPGIGRFALLRDVQGAMFYLATFLPPQQG